MLFFHAFARQHGERRSIMATGSPTWRAGDHGGREPNMRTSYAKQTTLSVKAIFETKIVKFFTSYPISLIFEHNIESRLNY